MTDVAFLLSVLEDGKPHSQAELLRLSFEQRGCGLTIHSRVADLRAQGHVVSCQHVRGKRRGEAWVYRLLASTPAPPPEPAPQPEPSLFAPDPTPNRPVWA